VPAPTAPEEDIEQPAQAHIEQPPPPLVVPDLPQTNSNEAPLIQKEENVSTEMDETRLRRKKVLAGVLVTATLGLVINLMMKSVV
jgi:hypothetical protein